MNWKKAETVEREDCRIIRYRADEMPEAVIESRRHNVPHANGHSGFWQYTDYALIANGTETTFSKLADAKAAAEKIGGRMNQQNEIIRWAKTRIRITNKAIRDRWGVDEETADHIYKCLKDLNVIGRMGYVERERS